MEKTVKVYSILNTTISEMAMQASLFSVSSEHFSRKRKLPFSTLLRFILGMQGNSLNKEIYNYFKTPEQIMTASALVQQRAKLLPHALKYLFNTFNSRCKDRKTTNGYHLYALDGTDLQIQTDDSSDTHVNHWRSDGYNMLHINTLYDVSNNIFSDIEIQPKSKTNEPGAAVTMIQRYSFPKNSIVLADRGYPALNLFEWIHRTENLDYLFRCKNDYIKEIKCLPMAELDVDISFELRTTQTNDDKELYRSGKAKFITGKSKFGKYKKSQTWDFSSPYRLTLRVVRFLLDTGEYETIITSLPRDTFPPKRIKELYHARWSIETSYRVLKYAVGMIHLHSKKEEFILQEIYARFIMYNLSSRIANEVSVVRKDGSKWGYHLNLTMVIHICYDYFRTSGASPPDLYNQIAGYILPIRPDRHDKRKLSQRVYRWFNYRVS